MNEPSSLSHDSLVKVAEKWLRNAKGCAFAFAELRALTRNGETPDAIGFRSDRSILVECKASRSDFLSDKKKRFRRMPDQGMGMYRFYMCPTDLIKPDELPEGWGLVYVNAKGKASQKVGPKGNYWENQPEWRHEFSHRSERDMMFSALRRLHLRGVIPMIYDSPFKEDQ